MQSSQKSTPSSEITSCEPHLAEIGALILSAGASRAALSESIAAIEVSIIWLGVLEPEVLRPMREACAVFALLSCFAPDPSGRCACGAALAYYTGAGASGVLCPVCDEVHAAELLEVDP